MAHSTQNQKPFILNFDALLKTFADICPDFWEEPNFEHPTVGRRYAEQVIFKYSYKAKMAKVQKQEPTWTLVLRTEDQSGKRLETTIAISTRFFRPPQQQPFVMANILQLTFKEASLLAVFKYCQLVPHLVQRKQLVLTPLAGAVFRKEDIPKLAKALNEPLADMMMAILCSCQTDGYFLKHSQCYIAVAALNKTISDKTIRSSIIKKTIKLYKMYNKEFDMEKYKVLNQLMQQQASSPINDLDKLLAEIENIDKSVYKPVFVDTNEEEETIISDD